MPICQIKLLTIMMQEPVFVGYASLRGMHERRQGVVVHGREGCGSCG